MEATSPVPSDASSRAEELTTSQAWSLVRESVVGRLAVLRDDGPDLFPVNFAVDHGTVVIRTAGGAKYEAAHHAPVAFEVDGYDVERGRAWSVVLRGKAMEVVDTDEVIDLMTMPLLPWHRGVKPHLLRLVPSTVTGRRFEVLGGVRTPRGGE